MDYKVHKAGNLRGDKITYPDGTGCCIWIPFKKEKDPDIIEQQQGCPAEKEEPGLCFDFSASDLEDLRQLAHILIEAEPDTYVPDPKHEAYEEKRKKQEKLWWHKVKEWLEDIHIGISPFEWRFTTFLVSRPVNHKRMLMFQWCKGFIFGPLRVTWH